MLDKIESFLLNKFLGKICARLAVTIVAFAAGAPAQALLVKFGVHAQIDQGEFTAGLIAGGQAAFEYFKARRMNNPNSVTTQTDPAKIPVGPIPG